MTRHGARLRLPAASCIVRRSRDCKRTRARRAPASAAAPEVPRRFRRDHRMQAWRIDVLVRPEAVSLSLGSGGSGRRVEGRVVQRAELGIDQIANARGLMVTARDKQARERA